MGCCPLCRPTSLDDAISKLTVETVRSLPPRMRSMLRGAPNVGEIADDVAVGQPAVIRSEEFGHSSASPLILEIPVAPKRSGILNVGQLAHRKLFRAAPPFVFNVNFSCAHTDVVTGTSAYADPRSHW
jgi:hypothetical protein